MSHLIDLVDRVQKITKSNADLMRLKEAVTKWSPDTVERNFWFGHCTVVGMVDICNANFRDDDGVRAVIDDYSKLNH